MKTVSPDEFNEAGKNSPRNAEDPQEPILWIKMLRASRGSTQRTVRIGQIAMDEMGVHRQWVSDTVKYWNREGWVQSFEGGMKAKLTDKGLNRTRR